MVKKLKHFLHVLNFLHSFHPSKMSESRTKEHAALAEEHKQMAEDHIRLSQEHLKASKEFLAASHEHIEASKKHIEMSEQHLAMYADHMRMHDCELDLKSTIELVHKALWAYYADKRVILFEDHAEDETPTVKTTIDEMDFIIRAIADTYADQYDDYEKVTQILDQMKNEERVPIEDICYPKKDICIAVIHKK